MYNSQEIAERIKQTASEKGVSLGNMFSELGISNNTLHNMKSSMPKTDTLAKIADYLKVSMDYLLGRESAYSDIKLENIPELAKLADEFRNQDIRKTISEWKMVLSNMSTENLLKLKEYASLLLLQQEHEKESK